MDSLAGYVATGVVTFLVGLALRSLEPKVKIVWWSPHQFFFQLTEQNISLWTHAITIQNIGRKASEGIEIVHRQRPEFFKLQPALNYKEEITLAGEHIIRINSLGPKEFFTIEMLAYRSIPELLFIRSEAGQSQAIQIQPQRVFPRWFNWMCLVLMVIGFGFVVYWLLRMGLFLLRGTGVL